ncbi:hypothetical protein AB1Y20_013951 [Prymnesium parvum]|uniref:Uncharacterized protein n=1 Tax=Prymnesium parvum TaxID=97485 RepID=A0AB34IFX5_PRYPA
MAEPVLHVLREALTAPTLRTLGESLASGATSADELTRVLLDSRPAFLRLLHRLGVSSLSERQRAANAIAKALREARLPPPGATLPTPPAREALEHAVRLLELHAHDERVAPLWRWCDGAQIKSDPNALRGVPRGVLISALEALGLSPATARLVPEALEHRELRVGFWSKQLCERGTEIALFDYADFGERLLGWTSFVLYPAKSTTNDPATVQRFRSRFGERLVAFEHTSAGWANQPEVDAWMAELRLTHVYIIKYGLPGEPEPEVFARTGATTLVHAVFDARQPHGDVYARISPCVPGRGAVVPHIVRPIDASGADLRGELGIPADATVFGRHGGRETFNIPEARHAVAAVARRRRDIFFLLLNTDPLHDVDEPNVLYLEPTVDLERKAAFIRTCDAMLHARQSGETFGLAIAEFSVANRPVITSSVHHDDGAARFHLDVLGDRGLYYRDSASLIDLLLSFDRNQMKQRDWNAYGAFQPEKVMQTFKRVFLLRQAA